MIINKNILTNEDLKKIKNPDNFFMFEDLEEPPEESLEEFKNRCKAFPRQE